MSTSLSLLPLENLYPAYAGLSIVLVFLLVVFIFRKQYYWMHVLGCIISITDIFLVSEVKV